VTVRQLPRLLAQTPHAIATAEGLERAVKGVPWYLRLFRRTPVMLWRFWAILNSHMLLLISSNGRPDAMEKRRLVLDRITASVHLPDRDILLGRHFTEMVVSLARSYFPQLPVAVIDDGHLQFGSQPVSLVGLHRRYLASPEDLPTQVRSFLAEMEQELPAANDGDSWQEIRRNIYPVLLTELDAEGAADVQREEWVNGLSVGYIVDDKNGSRAVTTSDVKLWHADADSLHQQALRNLVGKSREQMMEMHNGEGYTMLLLSAPDRHNAARILLPEFHRVLREHLGATFYAAMPTREFLLAFATTDESVLKRVCRQIGADYSRAKRPLSAKLFVVTADGVAGDPREE
jgi:hypothetical protein